MNNDNSNIEDQLLLRFLKGDVNPEESAVVENWLESDAANREYLEKLKSVWTKSSGIRVFDQIDVDKNWDEVKFKLKLDESRQTKQVFMLPRLIRIAAAVLLIATVTFLVSRNSDPSVEMMTLIANSDDTSFELPDGTEVWLNKGSRLIYPSHFSSDEREVELKGEGFFEVEHNASHPFLVNVGQTQTRVLGTSFNIREASDIAPTELVLVTGKVQFSLGDSQVILAPGDRVVVNEKGELVKEVNPDLNFMAWKTRTLVFESTATVKAIEDIAKLYGVQITIENKSFETQHFTTKFDNDSLSTVFEAIETVFGVQVISDGDSYIIR